MKGIILAGGEGTRLYPLTIATSKQLLPVYNKPMIFYPLSTLMLAEIKEVLIISTRKDTPRIKKLLGNGSRLGMSLEYAIQKKPEGLAQAFTIGKDFIGDDSCAMILGDNIIYGNGLKAKLNAAKRMTNQNKAAVFGYYVEKPTEFGIMEIERISDDKDNGIKVISIEEKPANPKSKYAIVGLYFYPVGVSKMAENVKPSERGELEITTLNDMYLQEGRLNAQLLGRGFTWMDAGTIDSLWEATNFVCMTEQNQGMPISAPEEIAYRLHWINKKQLMKSVDMYGNSQYGERLKAVLEDRIV